LPAARQKGRHQDQKLHGRILGPTWTPFAPDDV
jgi:hypothetical protein